MTAPEPRSGPEPRPVAGPAAGSNAASGSAPATGPEAASGPAAVSGPEPAGSAAGEPQQRRSGLRDPAAAVRGLGAGTLGMEAIVLLLAIQPIRVLAGDLGGRGVGALIALAVAAVVLAGSMRRRWAWHAGTALQAALVLCGFLHPSLGVLGLIFAACWAYATHVRRTILG